MKQWIFKYKYISILILLLLLVGIGFGAYKGTKAFNRWNTYNKAETAYEEKNYMEAAKWLEKLDQEYKDVKQFYPYIASIVFKENKVYPEAIYLFKQLGTYRDSEQLLVDSKRLYLIERLNKNGFENVENTSKYCMTDYTNRLNVEYKDQLIEDYTNNCINFETLVFTKSIGNYYKDKIIYIESDTYSMETNQAVHQVSTKYTNGQVDRFYRYDYTTKKFSSDFKINGTTPFSTTSLKTEMDQSIALNNSYKKLFDVLQKAFFNEFQGISKEELKEGQVLLVPSEEEKEKEEQK